MKKRIFLFIALISSMGLAFYSCDKIDDPVKESTTPPPVDTTDSVIPVRKILIEDYTGHNCGNCPKAKKILDSIEIVYGEQIVGMGVHAGFFANPPINGCSPADFRTTAGTAFDNFFGISAAGNPNGMINRMDYPSLTHIKAYNDWKGIAASLITIPPDAQIEITNTYTSSTKTVTINLDSKFLNAMIGDYKLGVYIVEDSVAGCQIDYDANPQLINNYVNRFMLRGDVNSTWGEALATDPAANSVFTKSYSSQLNTGWNDQQCYVIAYIYNATTYEVIQAERKKIIP